VSTWPGGTSNSNTTHLSNSFHNKLQQRYKSITHLQQPQQSNMQQAYYDNNILASQHNNQWSQGANGPPVQPVNPMLHGFIQMPQNLQPFIQQQVYLHQQMHQQQAQQQQQYYTTKNVG
jgi:hypothetical protein